MFEIEAAKGILISSLAHNTFMQNLYMSHSRRESESSLKMV